MHVFEVRNVPAPVDLVHQIVPFHVGVHGRRQGDGACVVDADVNSTEMVRGLLGRRLHLILKPDVAEDGKRLSALLLDLGGGGVNSPWQFGMRVRCFGGDGDICAVSRRPERNSQADASASARDKERFPMKRSHSYCLLLFLS